MIAVISGVALGHVQSGQPCMPSGTTLSMKWDPYASEWGAYTIDGCTGVNPKLMLTAGTTYTFDQSDETNWYHPVGFAYIAGGAHAECKQDQAGNLDECPELGGEDGVPSTIQYYVDGVAVTDDESTFGLDAYEPLFFNSQDWWGEKNTANPFKVTLTIPADASYTRIYYFCHIHAGMSAEIEITGSTAAATTVLNAAYLGGETEASALAIYDAIVADHQKSIAAFDHTCGTYDAVDFDPDSEHATCSGKNFLYGSGAGDTFAKCLRAIDCKMHHDMAVSVEAGASKFATFARQMIPHHQNAVSMAKSLLKFHTAADYGKAGDPDDDDMAMAVALAHEIINAQNHQIQYMAGWLDSNPHLVKESDNMCYEQPPGAACTGTGGKDECAAGTHCSCGGRHPHHRRHLLFASMGHPMCQCHAD